MPRRPRCHRKIPISPLMESFGGRRCHLTGRWASARTFMTSIGPRSTHRLPHVYSAPLERFVTHSDKRCLVSNSFFIHPSKCFFSYFFTTWPFLFTPTQFHLSSIVHSSRTHAVTYPIVGIFGILFGAALSRFSRVRGSRCIRIFLVLRRGRGSIVFKDGYGIRFCRLLSIASRYSYVHCSYPSMC